jgi:hypothetical protein
MSLGLLRAEVWSREGSKRLNRITARVVPDSVLLHPAMIAHARLVVIGGDSHRLHEEVIAAGGLLREGRFVRFGTLREMNEALASATEREPSMLVKQHLMDLWPKNEEALRKAIEARMKERLEGLNKALSERADKEAADIETILTELLTAIQGQLNDQKDAQEYLPGLAPLEREQFDRNVDALRARVRAIPGEIEHEVAQIRRRFADPQARIFPVAVTFLVPQRSAGFGR